MAGKVRSAKICASAAARNAEPIAQVLETVISDMLGNDPGPVKILEIASGTGQHASYFASHLPDVVIQPSEYDTRAFASIAAYAADHAGSGKVLQPLHIDVTRHPADWPKPKSALSGPPFDMVLCCNMVHITPYCCTEGLFSAAGTVLRPEGLLVTYGPYAVDGIIEPESNIRFDQGLRAQDPSWGIRDTRALKQEAVKNGLLYCRMFDMPANNKTLVFRKQ